jgi:hypothetical protein
MVAICAWCIKLDHVLTVLDGTLTDLALIALEDDAEITHGVCERHYRETLAEAGL